MATFHAIAAIGNSIRNLLAESVPREVFPGAQFRLSQAANLASPPFTDLGVSIYLHRIAFNITRRNLPPRNTVDGPRFKPSVPLDLHFLITAWARTAEAQWSLLACSIRMLEDTPALPAAFLNQNAGSNASGLPLTVFGENEDVELVGENLNSQDLVNIWEVAKANQQPSVSYIARAVLIDSMVEVPTGGLVQSRVFDLATLAK